MEASLWAVIAPEDLAEELQRELEWRGLKPLFQAERFYLFSGPVQPLFWAQVTWKEVHRLPIVSISDAAKKLRPQARAWSVFSVGHHRRAQLILEQLRPLKKELHVFSEDYSRVGGAFTLLNEKEVLWCKSFDRPHPLGEISFVEDKSAPSRAYLKLWEALTLFGKMPKTGEKCLDLGASPGGWTWVLARLGANVLSVDRSPLTPAVVAMPGVKFKRGDAFQITKDVVGEIDWLCSDVICFPEKLLEFVEGWIASGGRNFICTLKFQGEANLETIEKFAKYGTITHLFHNKHELTWMREVR